MSTTDNPGTEPVLSDLLYQDAKSETADTSQVDDSATETETSDEVEAVEESEDTASESDESEDADTDTDVEPLHEVVIDGEAQQVNYKELVNGYQRQADATRKTMAAAEKSKQADAKLAQADEVLKVWSDVSTELDTLIMGDLKEVDWNAVRDSDPSEYLRLKEVEASRQKVITDAIAKRNQIVKQRTEKEAAELHKALKWDDGAKKQADIQRITGYMQEMGITDQVTSHKLMLALDEAAKYRELQKAKAETKKELKLAPKTTKPIKTSKPSAPKSLEDMLYK